jgi:hypothetical protein
MSEHAMPNIEVVITVADDHLGNIKRLVAQLEGKGLKVSTTMENLGIISGTVAHADLPQLRNLKGVSAVESNTTVKLAPPDADIQ